MESSIKFIITVLLVFICSTSTTLAYSSGAPSAVCNSMLPGHGATPQSTTAPYNLLLGQACYQPGTPITVTLQSNSNAVNFRGFLMQARTSNDGLDYYGTFNPAGNARVQTLSCSSGSNDAITHRSSGEVTQQIFTWTAPTGLTGNVILLATVVQNFQIFWVKKVNATLAPCSPTETTTSASNSSLTGGTTQSGATLLITPLTGGTTQSGATLPNSPSTGGTTQSEATLPNSPSTGGTTQSGATLLITPLTGGTAQSGATLPNSPLTGGTAQSGATLPISSLTGGTTPRGTIPFNPSPTGGSKGPRSSAPISLSNVALLTTTFMISAIVSVAM